MKTHNTANTVIMNSGVYIINKYRQNHDVIVVLSCGRSVHWTTLPGMPGAPIKDDSLHKAMAVLFFGPPIFEGPNTQNVQTP